MREIKFRAWDKIINKMTYDWDLSLRHSDIIDFMQYTGLKDKNGKEIYEGDILKFGHKKKKVIVNFNYGFWFGEHPAYFFSQSEMSNNSEVIGNIYENPELANK